MESGSGIEDSVRGERMIGGGRERRREAGEEGSRDRKGDGGSHS